MPRMKKTCCISWLALFPSLGYVRGRWSYHNIVLSPLPLPFPFARASARSHRISNCTALSHLHSSTVPALYLHPPCRVEGMDGGERGSLLCRNPLQINPWLHL
ncbi:hypothetical protein HOY80DRAFT_979485 [Tuber brumale]|nr:hypothetical protein HOY80DRAFT_979485 [Tuber brumale]